MRRTMPAKPDPDPDYSVDEERPRLSRAELVKHSDFWRRAAISWQEWAETLLKQPRNGLWGREQSQIRLGKEIRRLRRLTAKAKS